MAKQSQWYATSVRIIQATLAECKERGITDPKDIEKQIDAAYPFGMRKYHPYVMWLNAKQDLLGGKRKTSRSRDRAKLAEWEAMSKGV